MGLTLCVPCNRHFSTASNLKAHVNLMHPEMMPPSAKESNFWNTLLSLDAIWPKIFIFFSDQSWGGGGTRNIFEISLWILWKKVFRANNSCYNHVNKHKGKTFCSICKKHLSTVSNLNAHVAQKHPGFSESSLLATFRKHLEFSLAKQTSIFLWYLFQVIFKQKVPSKPFGYS